MKIKQWLSVATAAAMLTMQVPLTVCALETESTGAFRLAADEKRTSGNCGPGLT